MMMKHNKYLKQLLEQLLIKSLFNQSLSCIIHMICNKYKQLKAAKKRKIVDFKGQILLKGAHDNVPITLLVDNDDNGGDNDKDKNKEDEQKKD